MITLLFFLLFLIVLLCLNINVDSFQIFYSQQSLRIAGKRPYSTNYQIQETKQQIHLKEFFLFADHSQQIVSPFDSSSLPSTSLAPDTISLSKVRGSGFFLWFLDYFSLARKYCFPSINRRKCGKSS
jgi:hypothetical protein